MICELKNSQVGIQFRDTFWVPEFVENDSILTKFLSLYPRKEQNSDSNNVAIDISKIPFHRSKVRSHFVQKLFNYLLKLRWNYYFI